MLDPNDIPADIIEAAEKLRIYFAERNIDQWKLMGVQSRVDTQPLCRYPLCQSEAEQSRIADEVYRELYSGEPAQGERQLMFPESVKAFFEDKQGERQPYVMHPIRTCPKHGDACTCGPGECKAAPGK